MKSLYEKYKLQFKVWFAFVAITLVIMLVFYPLIPKAFDYSISNNDFLRTQNAYFIGIGLFIIILHSIIVFIKLSFLSKFNSALENNEEKTLSKIRNQLFKVPGELYAFLIIVPGIIVFLLYYFIAQISGVALLKTIILYMSLVTIIATFCTLYIREEFSRVLSKIHIQMESFERKSSLIRRMGYQIIPLIIVSLVFTYWIGNSLVPNINSTFSFKDINSFNIILSLICIFSFNIIAIYMSSKSIAKTITAVSNGMENFVVNPIADNNVPITSNDEIGELIVSFNKVQNLTIDNIIEIKNNEQMLMEKVRLASLGELIGGIAHNMKTPIMSTAGAAEGLIELIAEYRASIDNPQVTSEDHKEIAEDMLDWVTRIKSYNSYMSDIITAVKGQASQLASNDNEKFTLYDVSKRVELLINHEIKKANLTLNTQIKCDPSITLNGDINSLVQVVNNLISNAIYAYEGEPDKEVKYIIDSDDNFITMQVIDEGCGMDNETKSKLFKQMYTTKGINGTGLGLYMSYSTIRGKFNGTITFESVENEGSTFTVKIPRK